MNKNSKVLVAGHRGMVGSAFVRKLESAGYLEVVTATRDELDLSDQSAVDAFLSKERPEAVFLAAAKVGGIHANDTYPADFIYDNLMIAANVIHASWRAGVKRLLFLGSSCIYPKQAEQPITEDALLTAPLEPTNEAYAVAKIAGLKLCQYYRKQHGVLFHSAMPTNLYGPGDNYHPENSHVIPAMLRRFHEAKECGDSDVKIWGTGTPRREFLHVDDLADASLALLQASDPPDWINVGFGEDISILELARLVAETVGFEGEILTDTTKPDGTPRKLLDCSRLRAIGWSPRIPLREGLASAYASFLKESEAGAVRAT
ncbi:MAG: GDP-L-fucose synthase [Verrucomicrobiota bacterium]